MPGEIIAENIINDAEEKSGESKETPVSKPVIGIIYPPPEVRSILYAENDITLVHILQINLIKT